MAIRNVVCRGFGPGATIAFVVTRGYGIGAAQELVNVRDFAPTPRTYAASFSTVKTFSPEARDYSTDFDTVRTFAPTPRTYSVTVSTEREAMTTRPNIAPGETRIFSWTFTLGASETISASTALAAVQNCSLSGSKTISGSTVTQKVAVATNATIGAYAQVRCRLVTSTGRTLDKTIQCRIAKHKTAIGQIDTNDVDDITLDATDIMGAGTVSSVACTMDVGDATLGTPTTTTTSATVRMSGQTEESQDLQFQITTSLGEVIREIAALEVAEL